MSLYSKKKEKFDSDEDKNNSSTSFGLGSVFVIFLFAISFYLSWTCNLHKDPGERVVRAIFAGFFGFFYLIFYLVTKSDCHSNLKQTCEQFSKTVSPLTN